MPELRRVDPRALKPNPDNPRKVPVPEEMDQQLAASIAAIGLLQPPVVREIGGELVIRAGDRRTKAAIAAGKEAIDVYILDGPEDIDPMASMSENLVRVGMNPVDTWRGIDRLEQQGWNEEAIANALALPVRTVRKLKLLGKLHPPMLDVMAKGSMPNDEQLRTIANAPAEDQAQVWKALKPKKAHDVSWWEIARALSKPRIPLSAAKFDHKMAEEYGLTWVEDLFAPAGEDSRYTSNAEAFFAAQEAWVRENLPANGTVLTLNEYDSPVLPKGAERIYGKPGKHDKIGHYVDPRSGEVRTVAYRLPEPKKPAKGGKGTPSATAETTKAAKARPDVTQKGQAMIGDYRTDALHQALRDNPIDDLTLIALLVLALAGKNVSVQSGLGEIGARREALAAPLCEGGVLTSDDATIHAAARQMLAYALSCRANMSDSGLPARIAGSAIGADALLPNMAIEEFLACLSRQALERSAHAESVRVEARVKHTRAGMIARFRNATWRFPGTLFAPTAEEIANGSVSTGRSVPGSTQASTPFEEDDNIDEVWNEDTPEPEVNGGAETDAGGDAYPAAAE